MGLTRVWSVALVGVDGVPVEIEADIGGGKPRTQIVGLPDAALNEAKDRVRAATRNSGLLWPDQAITLALSPAALPKGGSGYDLALAVAVQIADNPAECRPLSDTVFIGELALDGRLRAVRGVLPCLMAARRSGITRAVVPRSVLPEAALVRDMAVLGADQLTEVLRWIRGAEDTLHHPTESAPRPAPAVPDLSDVVGQQEGKWALEVAAAGGHNLLFIGPPGAGKSMLARRLPGILPDLTPEQALEVTAVHSIVGGLSTDNPLITVPPFIAPHHTTSVAALTGGGVGLAKPGAMSKAHRGILFLDEVCEFAADRLECLRTALEEGEVRLARRDGIVRYPAACQVVMATNPCPCAPIKDRDCMCTAVARRRYLTRLSGPLLDRVDLQIRIPAITAMAPHEDTPETSATVAARVRAARARATHRWRENGWHTNAEVPGPALRREFPPPPEAMVMLDRALATGALTARGADRCIRVAWTLADLAEAPTPIADHIAAALHFRDRLTLQPTPSRPTHPKSRARFG
ncbi:YifB family Mg chelatase-like AAA ATPase [Actinokineospora sp. UTMC 2448]|uniref:YifB family Mg chelatase-like AAA ATPase n=1 Tax=Actinokineospora sp. UTMC 2448 TaxID=2268449 RepID=UPI002164310F|nr:YifB family Mg chelatase-like AAA ATPase [Actinokineospora sp. UTMC 2448]UVS81113.1 Competence protein ComM [Actinokineospora sp. UTMC 2448]